MTPNLKLVGGTATNPFQREMNDYGTASSAISIEDYLGEEAVRVAGKKLNEQWQDIAHYAAFESRIKALSKTSAAFTVALAQWKDETKFQSSLTEIFLHPAYQRIIGLGPDVVPFVLRELQVNGGHWFWALRALTGENPVPAEDEGRTKRMTEAWIHWGTNVGLI